MNRDIYRQFAELLKVRRVEYAGPDARANAQNAKDAQHRYWKEYIESIRSTVLSREQGSIDSWFFDNINFDQVYTMEVTDDVVTLIGNAPIMSVLDDSDKAFIQKYSSEAIAAFLYEWYVYFNKRSGVALSLKLTNEFVEYGIHKNVNVGLLSDSQDMINRALLDASDISERRTEIEQELIEISIRAREEFQSFKDSIVDKESLKHVFEVWGAKKRSHNFWSTALFALIVLVISVSIFGIYSSRDWILSAEINNENGVLATAMLVASILAVAWIIKLLMSLMRNHAMLSQDAGLRKALVETYIDLVSRPEAKLEGADRIYVLAALFRPVGGTTVEDVLPPTWVDLLKNKE